jgi:regulator of protease activity HflC (stomatin/prohibitin superfamily)
MTSALLAIFTIIAGGLIRLFSTTTGRNPGMTRLISYGVMTAGVALLAMNSVILIDVGEVGVEHFLGSVNQRPHAQGVHVVNPLASIEKMSVREQSFPQGGTVERIEAQTSEQLNVTLEVSVLYQIEPSRTPTLFQELGTERQITAAIVLNSVRNGVRDAVATRSINEIFSPDRAELSDNIEAAIQASAEDRINVVQAFVRDIQAPEGVRQAIEERQQREQQVAQERFQTEIIQERARQQIEEARGIAEAQRIISEGLTPEYLTFHYIEKLGELPAGSVVYVPTEGGIPLMRSLGGSD